MKTPTAIFFDLDETLISNTLKPDDLFGKLFNKHLDHLNNTQLEPFRRSLLQHAETTWNNLFDGQESPAQQIINCFAKALQTIDCDKSIATTMFNNFIELSTSHTHLNKNALTTINQLRHQGFSIGIITNGIEAIQLPKIERHGLQHLVDHVIISEHARAHKPSGQVFNFALNKLRVNADDAWHVGDHVNNDVAGAIHSGMQGIFYDPTHIGKDNAFADTPTQPSRVINDLAELIDLLN